MRREHGALSVETKNRSVNVGFTRPNTNIVREITRRKIIRAVDDDVVARDQILRVLAREPAIVQFDVDIWVRIVQTFSRRFQFAAANVFRAVQNLTVQVRKIDIVRIDQSNRADSGRREIKRSGGTESAGANAQNARRFQSTLSLDADLRENEMARIARELFGAKLRLRDSLFDFVHHAKHTTNLEGHAPSCPKYLGADPPPQLRRGGQRGALQFIWISPDPN